ncbi:hypothetical protein POM88_042463 [Heracleum sosnowskyi]|uniref:Uncharacterized protein n=1 Tax=Heracleum sosnowskyi TaxID=360622 RepID=A0AAD8MBM5_9APIA|nr:hypothetical protein POM88_042463 [Heracleum sosnowskyi]
MDFTPLPSNPNHRPPSENPFLLGDMERHQFIHSSTSAFKVFSPKNVAPRLKRARKGFKSPSIPFYQSSKFQNPQASNPKPRKPYWPKVYTRQNYKYPTARPLARPAPTPQLINPSDSGKYLNLIKNVQPGIKAHVHGGILEVLRNAKWEGMLSRLGRVFYVHLMGEFYYNMRVIKGLNGILHFTTTVDRKTILVDHNTINKGLHLPIILSEKPCIDFYAFYIFNKSEFELMLGIFCDSDVPLGLCDANCGIHYKHFTSKFQYLSLILRANVLPKPKQVF